MGMTIGLTGSIASGKSTVSLMFDDFGIPVIDADKVAREVVEPGEPAYEDIIELFGREILRDDKMLDRQALGEIVFADKEKLQQLNEITHPRVRQAMLTEKERLLADDARCVVLDIPLLFESKLEYLVDRTVVVYVDEDVQLKRLLERDQFTEKEALQRIQSQLPVHEKAERADAIINNNGTKFESYEQLEQLLKKWGII